MDDMSEEMPEEPDDAPEYQDGDEYRSWKVGLAYALERKLFVNMVNHVLDAIVADPMVFPSLQSESLGSNQHIQPNTSVLPADRPTARIDRHRKPARNPRPCGQKLYRAR